MTIQPLSQDELAASDILAGYGLDFIPAWIGRARSRLAGLSPTAQTIADCVIGMVNAEQLAPSASSALEAAHHQENLAFLSLLRETVELERAKFLAAKPGVVSGPAGKTRMTLYPDKMPRPDIDPSFAGTLRMLGRTISVRAWVSLKGDFINLELCPLPQ